MFTIVVAQRNGDWRARIDTVDGRTIKVGGIRSSPLEAKGDLMTRYPEYFGIRDIVILPTVTSR